MSGSTRQHEQDSRERQPTRLDRQPAERVTAQRYLRVVAGEARRLKRQLRLPELPSGIEVPAAPTKRRGVGRRDAFAVYFAALDREGRAAADYAARVDQVYTLVSRDRALCSPGQAVDRLRRLRVRRNARRDADFLCTRSH